MTWKTVVIDRECTASLSLNTLKVKFEDDYIKVPIGDLQTVIFSHERTVITIPLISALIENNVGIIITNGKKDPIGIFQPFNSHSLVFKQISNQIEWKVTRKKKLWKLIVQEKIKSEMKMMEFLGVEDEVLMRFKELIAEVKSDDATNREGLSAKLYFTKVFGSSFIRHSENTVNYALDYGYKILASYISRFIASRGYLTQLGIHHIGSSNPFNLTYDFIEVFRVFIDYFVISQVDYEAEFKMEDRHELHNILNYKVLVNGKRERLSKAIDKIIDSYFGYLIESSEEIIRLDYTRFNLFHDTE